MAKKSLIPDGLISRAVREGLILRKQLLADGMAEAEADRIVGHALKKAWQTSVKSEREDPWHYYCAHCKDTGWIIGPPSAQEQQRLQCLYGDNPQHQDYMTKCDPCRWIERERAQRRKLAGIEEGLVAAGQTKRGRR